MNFFFFHTCGSKRLKSGIHFFILFFTLVDVFLTDELLIEILCLYDFRRVSKKWREIISSSYFKELLRKRNNKL